MDIYDLILQRRTVHSYKREPVSESLLRKAIQAGLYAPNHKLTYPWRFTWVGNQTRSRLCEVFLEVKKTKTPESWSSVKEKALSDRFMAPGALLVIGCQKCEDNIQSREDYATVACALQNMALFLWSEGLGTKWSSGPATRHQKTYEILDIDPNREEIVGFFWVGVAEQVPKVAPRPLVEEVLRRRP